MTSEETWKRVHDRVRWWLEDMAFKAPELLTDHYFECMAQDIADFAINDFEGKFSTLSSAQRLDPPES